MNIYVQIWGIIKENNEESLDLVVEVMIFLDSFKDCHPIQKHSLQSRKTKTLLGGCRKILWYGNIGFNCEGWYRSDQYSMAQSFKGERI